MIEKAGEQLKKVEGFEVPVWAPFVKTGVHKERPPVNTDWFYTRSAAILRKLYKQGPVGVSKLRTLYGGKKNRGHQPEKFFRGSGSILRKALQQLEKAGFAKQVEKGRRKGRIITPKGKQFLDKIASQLAESAPKKEEAPKKPQKEEKAEEAKKKEEKKVAEKKETPKAEKKEEPKEKQEAGKKAKAPASKEEPAQKNG